jgi:nitrogen fixation/metabolism regulation signal transduction histidine kinase
MTRDKNGAAPAAPSYKRRQYWVDAPLQLQMVGFVLVLVTLSLALSTFSAYSGLQDAAGRSPDLYHDVAWIEDALRAPLILASAIALLASGLVTLFWSHRFAGPLRVLAAGIARARHGNLGVAVRVRETDAHQDLAREFQGMQDELRKMLEADRARVAEAVGELEAAEKTLHEGPARKHVEKALARLRQACAQYHL